jgi:ubiquinone/menaquinone biosynthesis C-methylase UbiE
VNKLEIYKHDWEALAAFDPMWAVLTEKNKRNRKWDQAEFFLSGEEEIASELSSAARFMPAKRERALDFGCGIGRLTRALGSRFQEVWGVDISQRMIDTASDINRAYPNCHFAVNPRSDLQQFPDSHFDIVYTARVLQHIPESLLNGYLAEFIRVLRPDGLLIFQLPDKLPLIWHFQPRRTVFKFLEKMGFGADYILRHFPLQPMRMTAIREREVIRRTPAKLLRSYADERGGKISSRTYYFRSVKRP